MRPRSRRLHLRRRMGAVVVSTEDDERFPVGPRGAQGAQGARGERGLSRLQGRAIVVPVRHRRADRRGNLFLDGARGARAAGTAQHQEQAAQQRQGAVLEAKLCISLDRLAALKPPAGDPASNPARAYAQQEHAVLAQLGPDVGCK